VEGKIPELFNGKNLSKSREFGFVTILTARPKVPRSRSEDMRS